MPDISNNTFALFIDYENFINVDFDLSYWTALFQQRGRIIYKRGYGDWGRFHKAKRQLHRLGVDLVEVPSNQYKNTVDMKLCVDALDLAWIQPHINHFVIFSGDRDYIPLITKLREYGRTVIIVGSDSTSSYLRHCCDEILHHPTEPQTPQRSPVVNLDFKNKIWKAVETIISEDRPLRSSQIKQVLTAIEPDFDERQYGFEKFQDLIKSMLEAGDFELISSNHGDYTLRVAPQREAQQESNTPTKDYSTRQVSQFIQTTPARTELLQALYWASIILGEPENQSLSDAANLTRKICDPFSFTKFGFSKKKGFKGIFYEVFQIGFFSLPVLTTDNKMLFTRQPTFDAYAEANSWTPSTSIFNIGRNHNAVIDGVIDDNEYLFQTLPKLSLLLNEMTTPTIEELVSRFSNDCERQDIQPGPITRTLELLKRCQSIQLNDENRIVGFEEDDKIRAQVNHYMEKYNIDYSSSNRSVSSSGSAAISSSVNTISRNVDEE